MSPLGISFDQFSDELRKNGRFEAPSRLDREALPASWLDTLRQLAPDGMLSTIEFVGVSFEGPCNLSHLDSRNALTFARCEFRDRLSFDFSSFDRPVKFSDCVFLTEVSYRAAKIFADLEFDRSIFQGKADFTAMQVTGNLNICDTDVTPVSVH